MGQNVFSIDLDAARSAMLGDPYVKSAALTRRLPDTILVTIEERVPAALVVIGPDSFLVTREGETFKRLRSSAIAPDLPVITGLLSSSPRRTARPSRRTAKRRALDVAIDYQQSTLASKLALQEIHVEPNISMSLSVGSAGQGVVSLVLGQTPWRRKLDEAARVVAELERRGQKPDAILLDQSSRPERVVARVR